MGQCGVDYSNNERCQYITISVIFEFVYTTHTFIEKATRHRRGYGTILLMKIVLTKLKTSQAVSMRRKTLLSVLPDLVCILKNIVSMVSGMMELLD